MRPEGSEHLATPVGPTTQRGATRVARGAGQGVRDATTRIRPRPATRDPRAATYVQVPSATVGSDGK